MPASPLCAMNTTGSTDSKIIAQCKQLKEINPKLSCVSARAVRGNYSNKLRRLTINLVPARPRADLVLRAVLRFGQIMYWDTNTVWDCKAAGPPGFCAGQ